MLTCCVAHRVRRKQACENLALCLILPLSGCSAVLGRVLMHRASIRWALSAIRRDSSTGRVWANFHRWNFLMTHELGIYQPGFIGDCSEFTRNACLVSSRPYVPWYWDSFQSVTNICIFWRLPRLYGKGLLLNLESPWPIKVLGGQWLWCHIAGRPLNIQATQPPRIYYSWLWLWTEVSPLSIFWSRKICQFSEKC